MNFVFWNTCDIIPRMKKSYVGRILGVKKNNLIFGEHKICIETQKVMANTEHSRNRTNQVTNYMLVILVI